MDHSQRKPDSNLDADEEALSTVSKQVDDLEWKQFIQKELEKPDSNPDADEEALSTVSKQEDDLEWKQFIQKELEKLENQEKDEVKEDSEKTSSVETEYTLSSLIEQIPLEILIDLAKQFFKKKKEQEKTKPKKQNRKKATGQRGADMKESKAAIPKENDCNYRPPYPHDEVSHLNKKTEPEKTEPKKQNRKKEIDPRGAYMEESKAAIPKENDCRYRPPYPHDEVNHFNKKKELEKTEPKKQNRKKEIDPRGTYMEESKAAIPKENDCRYRPPYPYDEVSHTNGSTH